METRDVLWVLGSAFNAPPLLPGVQLCLASKTILQVGHIKCELTSPANKNNASVERTNAAMLYTVFTVAPYFNN